MYKIKTEKRFILTKVKITAKAAFSCLMLLILYGCSYPGNYHEVQTVAITDDHADSSDVFEAVDGHTEPDDSDVSQKKSRDVIYVCGAVNCPGVYELPSGSRVYEVLTLAGGLRRDASETAVNQAELLTDGQMIRIPTKAEELAAASAEAEASDGLVNINTAGVEELKTLPGVGDSKANSIIAYREKNGPFKDVEELMNIEGIKSGVFAKLEGYIKVN